jgi:precorrin-2 methylase
MGRSLDGMDLNSSSTDRGAAAAALEGDLQEQGLVVEAAASFDEEDEEEIDEFQSLMDFAAGHVHRDTLSEMDRAARKAERIILALRSQNRDEAVADYARRMAWSR